MKEADLDIDKEKSEDGMMAIKTDQIPPDIPIENILEMDFDWEEMLKYYNDNVMLKTLMTTTQYFQTYVEAENCTYPLQHLQKQLFPLH
eukprot:14235728-Ditylum_brightwellii.AAC.1